MVDQIIISPRRLKKNASITMKTIALVKEFTSTHSLDYYFNTEIICGMYFKEYGEEPKKNTISNVLHFLEKGGAFKASPDKKFYYRLRPGLTIKDAHGLYLSGVRRKDLYQKKEMPLQSPPANNDMDLDKWIKSRIKFVKLVLHNAIDDDDLKMMDICLLELKEWEKIVNGRFKL